MMGVLYLCTLGMRSLYALFPNQTVLRLVVVFDVVIRVPISMKEIIKSDVDTPTDLNTYHFFDQLNNIFSYPMSLN